MVAPAALVIQTRALPAAKRKKAYRATLLASGGTGQYTWKRSKGKLPKGLTLTRSGVLIGKPKARTSKRFRVQVTDSAGRTSRVWLRIRVR
jgi:hypothetical protein